MPGPMSVRIRQEVPDFDAARIMRTSSFFGADLLQRRVRRAAVVRRIRMLAAELERAVRTLEREKV